MSNDVQTNATSATGSAGTSTPGTGAAAAPHAVPPVDVFEDENGITLFADLPGVSRERLSVRVDGDTLLVEGTAQADVPEGLELVYGEARLPTYRREFTLSRELDSGGIEAQLKDGVLRLRIPKAEEAKPRRVEVQVG